MTVSAPPTTAFTPITVGRSALDHRVVMAPLTRHRAPSALPNELMEEYYEQRAVRAGTLIISEATYIAEKAGGYADVPGIWSQEQVDAWAKIFKRIHNQKSFVYVQLWALGRQAMPEDITKQGHDYVSASNIAFKARGRAPRPLTREEIKEYVQLYVEAAKNSIAAGADGVELHSANGYLPDQFLHENSNDRTDEYGGSIENRSRFTLEILDALVEAIGADRVGVRFSPWGNSGDMEYGNSAIPQFSYVMSQIEKRAQEGNRLAYVHIVEPRVSGSVDSTVIAPGNNDFVRQIWKGIIIKAGAMLPYVNEETEKDPKMLIGLGRYFISNPDLVDRLEKDADLTPYDRDYFYSEGKEGYTDYKTLEGKMSSLHI
jgi:NADPH2 dehydrogenase